MDKPLNLEVIVTQFVILRLVCSKVELGFLVCAIVTWCNFFGSAEGSSTLWEELHSVCCICKWWVVTSTCRQTPTVCSRFLKVPNFRCLAHADIDLSARLRSTRAYIACLDWDQNESTISKSILVLAIEVETHSYLSNIRISAKIDFTNASLSIPDSSKPRRLHY
jgi:hypothetical protein